MSKKEFLVKDWMIRLGLSGNELVAYAFLYDATKNGTEDYTGGYKLLTEVMNSTIPTTYNILNKLKQRGFIEVCGEGVQQGLRVVKKA